ncbi:MAG: DUF1320 domain-containing protein [Sphingomonadales bacterium]|nr:MAG: DUF1320 domain-containing protein [Sphingomonadales bacterium]
MYATLADMLARFSEDELVQLAQADDVVDTRLAERVATAIARVKPLIDGHVAAKYQIAGQPVPPLLTEISCDLARFALYRDTPPDAVKDARDQALKNLKDIAKGVIKLDQGEESLPAREGAVLVSRPPRVFGREAMEGF